MGSNKNGMNWINPTTRLAIYLRDGMACVYCGAGVEDTRLSLDHLKPESKGGSHNPKNLVTCCISCNSARGNRSVRMFCKSVSVYLGEEGPNGKDLERFVRNTARRVLPRREARELLFRRGSVRQVLDTISK